MSHSHILQFYHMRFVCMYTDIVEIILKYIHSKHESTRLSLLPPSNFYHLFFFSITQLAAISSEEESFSEALESLGQAQQVRTYELLRTFDPFYPYNFFSLLTVRIMNDSEYLRAVDVSQTYFLIFI